MADIDVAKLTHVLETGKGCDVKEDFQHMTFEESLKTMKLIERQSKVDVLSDASLPTLTFHSNGGGYEAYAYLSATEPGFWGSSTDLVRYNLAIDDSSQHNAGDTNVVCSNSR